MNRQRVKEQIEKEFATAAHARSIGNDGMVRVCARRAAGAAIAFWLESHPRQGWGVNAMNQLQAVQIEETMPKDIQEAARRLTTKITEQFTSAFSEDPLEDSKTIIEYFLQQTGDSGALPP